MPLPYIIYIISHLLASFQLNSFQMLINKELEHLSCGLLWNGHCTQATYFVECTEYHSTYSNKGMKSTNIGWQTCVEWRWSASNVVVDEWTWNQLKKYIIFNNLKSLSKAWIVQFLGSAHQNLIPKVLPQNSPYWKQGEVSKIGDSFSIFNHKIF
jgi:hypothetical protein